MKNIHFTDGVRFVAPVITVLLSSRTESSEKIKQKFDNLREMIYLDHEIMLIDQ